MFVTHLDFLFAVSEDEIEVLALVWLYVFFFLWGYIFHLTLATRHFKYLYIQVNSCLGKNSVLYAYILFTCSNFFC